MKVPNANGTNRPRQREAGAALLISLFALLLIAVVAIALIVASGTETALTGNYHSATAAYYAAVAGLEEGRGRLLTKSPDYFNNTIAGFIPAGAVPVNLVSYIRNPIGGEAIDPTDLSAGNAYADREYAAEFPTVAGKTVQYIDSVYVAGTSGLPGPLYKWVRITAATEQSLGIDINGSGGALNHTRLTYYDPAHVDASGNITPSLISVNSPPSTAVQVFQITALAVLPNGSQKMLQYVVAPDALTLALPSPIVMDGNNVVFGPPTGSFSISGTDQDNVGSCTPGPNPVAGVGYTNGSDSSYTNIADAITVAGSPGRYTGLGGSFPNIYNVGPPPPTPLPFELAGNLMSVSGLNALVKTVTENADVVVAHDATQFDLPGTMSAANPMTVVINGDLNTNGWPGTGYGLLLVTGTFTYGADTSWRGLILVVGKGIFTSTSSGSGEIHGGLLIARLFDAGNTPLVAGAPLGAATFNMTGAGGGNGLRYSSCWIQASHPSLSYKVLSFREISQ
jgi:hypothetical protein